ncbi:class II fructose-bisphosphate aldolase [Demequina sp.]|uniref:class II fructose-bisphosphate aldolase n=1 Tax=Demequina sp. TaxID=2050685 RepID=UPI003A86B5C4
MPLLHTGSLLHEAARHGRAIGAFNVLHLETAEALSAGAERAGLPLILQISQNCVAFHGGLEPIGVATRELAHRSPADLSLHLDHAEDEELACAAIDLGFSSVMFDGSRLPYEDNVAATARVVAYAHARGAVVEAELGEIGGKDGAHAPGVRTDPAEAVQFVGDTGVDSLAVAVGSSHAMAERSAQLDLALIADLAAVVPVPLVLHGSSGVADDMIVAAIRAGIVKINVSTHLNKVFTQSMRAYLDDNPSVVDTRKYLGRGREAMADEVARMLTVFAAGAAVQSR